MARFVIRFRHTKEAKLAKESVHGFLETVVAKGVTLVGDTGPSVDGRARHVLLEGEPVLLEGLSESLPAGAVGEWEIKHLPFPGKARYPTKASESNTLELVSDSIGAPFSVNVVGGGEPVEGAMVGIEIGTSDGKSTRWAVTPKSGTARFYLRPGCDPTKLVTIPQGGFWTMVTVGPEDGMIIDLRPLPRNGPLSWWHKTVGLEVHDVRLGDGIRVGVIDSGVGPHRDLTHIKQAGSFRNLTFQASGASDLGSHGSHVCGIIAARPRNKLDFCGISPGATVFSIQALHFGPDLGVGLEANQGDIAAAIDHFTYSLKSDVINLSLGASESSQIIRDAVRDAYDNGILCVCAAGNSGGPIAYPAAFPETVAVGAIGLDGSAPDDAITASCKPANNRSHGADGLYLANFSNFGKEIDCCAPGVGIISTVPERYGLSAPYASMDGTSMASPIACGVLAAMLSRTQDYSELPRTAERADWAKQLLLATCRDIDLALDLQGQGVTTIRDKIVC